MRLLCGSFIGLVAASGAAVLAAASAADIVQAVPGLPTAPYAPWAHSHMVWLDSFRSNQSSVLQYVADYAAHNITVGGLDIDSEWATGDNNFVVDTAKFPDMGGLISQMHAQGINVILWVTSMVNTDSSNYPAAVNNSYLIKDGFNETAVVKWWHGAGGFIDYFNPAALKWWEQQMDNVLSLGLDGWKVDGTDPYLIEVLTPISYQGYITLQQYQNAFYGHFFNYTRAVNDDHCLIWSRPVDSYPLFLNLSAFLEFSPKYVMTAGWVGDQDPTFLGLRMALINTLESAWQNYANFGSDTGGYRSGNRTAEVLLRWAQVNAFLPLFENGGNDEHRPWGFDAPGSSFVADAYRALVAAHYELGPYLLAAGTAALLGGSSTITPLGVRPADFPFIVQPDELTDYSYLLGDSVYVVPVVAAGVTQLQVSLPAGVPGSPSWYSYWDAGAVYPAGSNATVPVPLNASAAFVRTGSILPLHVSTSQAALRGVGDTSFASALTAVVHTPARDGSTVRSVVPGWRGERSVALSYAYNRSAAQLVLEASPFDRDLIVVLRGIMDAGLVITAASSTCSGAASSAAVPLPQVPLRADAVAAAVGAAAVAWDAAGPAPVHPVAGLTQRLQAAAAPLQCTFSAVRGDGGGEDGTTLVIHAGSGSRGVRVTVAGLA